ncbi:hypothetical protein BDA96_02G082400 [Sorghum bicolor]|uniref:Uncharacterized protein n=1 Tax=Sorghum bicolor TaxID=4558 RepID=A0A921RMJ0_SORBI|nr:hypothetical protein BDA96_02G082400 [Sorghum bicolor]
MNRFKSVLDDLELKQLYLHSRCFTWRSEISFSDRFIFCNRDWEITNSNCYVQGRESAAPCFNQAVEEGLSWHVHLGDKI